MLTTKELELLTQVGPDAPLGKMMRRYWIPALLSQEIPGRDGPPKAVRLLGEALVAFRDSSGRVGLLEERCPHRLASLVYGRNEEGGLRCLYHGWKLDVAGCVLEMPCEPANSRFREHVHATAYETREAGGIVWAYLGPPDKKPVFPDFAFLDADATDQWATKFWAKCNWAQGVEGNLDSFHTNILHSGYEICHFTQETIGKLWKRPSREPTGRLYFERTDYGTHYAAFRRPTGHADHLEYLRIYEYCSPFFTSLSSDLGRTHGVSAYVPIDDENTMVYGMGAYEPEVKQGRVIFGPESLGGMQPSGSDKTARANVPRQWVGQFMADAVDADFRPLRNETNGYGQDRAAMERRDIWWAYSGIDQIGLQDLAMIESMGSVVDRTKEHLASSDFAIISWREAVVQAVKEFMSGSEPPGIDPPAPYREISSVMALVPVGTDWKTMTWQSAASRQSAPGKGTE
jgi:phthalate 4,5-dioxygenase oxygenase subunit